MSKQCVSMMHRDYRIIQNIADTRNTLHVNWLKWCGFKFTYVEHVNGVPFIHFYRIKD
ncbi:hypothetical protein ACXHXM_34185